MPVPQEVALIIPNFRNSYAVGWLESRCQQEKQSFVIILPTPSADVGLNFIEMKIHRALLHVNVTRTLNFSQISLLFAISFTRIVQRRHFWNCGCRLHIVILIFSTLSSTGSILSNTDLSDLSTVGTCDIFVYRMRHRVMWFARLADSILFIKRVITCHWNGFNENAMRRMFSKMN